MPTYRYTARDERGHAVNGTLAASTHEALADQLKRMGYLVTQAKELPPGAAESGMEAGGRVRYDDLALFNVQLSKMIQVGIPLVTALDTLATQTAPPRLRRAVQNVARGVEGGLGFSEALSRHGRIFSTVFINMVRAGEASGKLDEVLRRLAEFSRRQAEIRRQLQTALTYPAFLLAVGCVVAGVLVAGVIPQFMKIFIEAEVRLPLPTLLLYQVSQFVRHQWVWIIVGAVALAWGARGYLRTPSGRRQGDVLALRLPVIGPLVRDVALARFARTLETMLSSGVPILESLAIVQDACGNVVISDVVQSVQTSVREGGSLADPLRVSRDVPPMVVQMIAVGEASGTLDHMLGQIADHYDELVMHGIKRAITFVEPVFLMLMGGMVAFIMASILLPLFRMVDVVR